MAYSTSKLANKALKSLQSIVNGLKVNDLGSYVGDNSAVRNDFIRDENYIRNRMDNAANAAYNLQRAQALQDAAAAEDANYRSTQSAIAEMRRNLIGSASSGANVGAANASALQALLGLGRQNADLATEGLRSVNNVTKERTAQLAQNAVDAINTANDATSKMYDAATSAYASDRSYGAQGAAQALGDLAAASDTNKSNEKQTTQTNKTNERMNKYTSDTNLKIEKTTKKTKNVNKNK